MKNLKVTEIVEEGLKFENGISLRSNHDSDCCEEHYLSTDDLTMSDFEGLEFDLSNDDFFKRIEGYGIELIPVKGHSIKIPGYGYNNGYYSDRLDLVLNTGIRQGIRTYDITECQDING